MQRSVIHLGKYQILYIKIDPKIINMGDFNDNPMNNSIKGIIRNKKK